MTPEEWNAVETACRIPYLRITLVCDGYHLTLQAERIKHLRFGIQIYVNGEFRGKWLLEECEEQRRFLCPVKAYRYKPKQRAHLKKLKPRVLMELRLTLNPDQMFTYYRSWWASFAKLRAHLIRNNREISLAGEEEKSA